MSRYNYSSELPEPLNVSVFNFESRAVRPFLKMYINIAKKQLRKKCLPQLDLGEFVCYRVNPATEGKTGAILYCHGGGFIFPCQVMMSDIAGILSERLSCQVFLPEYRFAPDYPFPTPFEDCLNTYKYMCEHADELHIDPHRIAIYGDSAGGAIAASVSQALRDEGSIHTPACQMLIYPVTDNSMNYPSMKEYSRAAWCKEACVHMWNMYLPSDELRQTRYAVPINGSTESLPPAYIEILECDTLRDEGAAYAKKLKESGVRTELRFVAGAYHGYDSHMDIPFVKKELENRIQFLKDYLE